MIIYYHYIVIKQYKKYKEELNIDAYIIFAILINRNY